MEELNGDRMAGPLMPLSIHILLGFSTMERSSQRPFVRGDGVSRLRSLCEEDHASAVPPALTSTSDSRASRKKINLTFRHSPPPPAASSTEYIIPSRKI